MLINGKTPEEIKRRLKCASFDCGDIDCDDCECSDLCKSLDVSGDATNALALIERLESERDYLLNELVGRTCYPCRYCKHLELRVDEEPCNSCLRNPATTFGAIGAQCFEWRGVPKEDNHANV